MTGVDAPAGRLRVFTAAGRLAGTAGLVRRGDVLTGELWLTLTSATTVRSELETPATRGVHRTSHRLAPTPRWTLQWVTLAEPGALRDRFAALPALLLGAEAAALTAAGVRVNPWSAAPPDGREHLDLARVGVPGARLSAATGVPLSSQALIPEAERDDLQLRAALRASGVAGVLDDPAFGDAVALGFVDGRARMAPRVEAWLAAHPAGTTGGRPRAVVLGGDADVAIRALGPVSDWNGLYAYPRIVVGDGSPAAAPAAAADTATTEAPDPFAPLVRRAAPPTPTLAGLAGAMALPLPGLTVFNPSPFTRDDVVTLPGGRLAPVTDVPGLGYAFVPEPATGGAGNLGVPATRSLIGPTETARWRVTLDEISGAISSLVERESGRALVGLAGWNRTPGDLADAWIEHYPRVATRVVARRATPAGVVTSKLTLYDDLPWVDLENVFDDDVADETAWEFDTARPVSRVTREVAGGSVGEVAPLTDARVLHWIALDGDEDSLLLGTARPLRLTANPDGGLTARAVGTIRLRWQALRGVATLDQAWRLGFAMTPLQAYVSPGGGPIRLPSFGRLVDVTDPAVAVVGFKEADDGVGVIAYLLNLGGPARDVTLRSAVLTFAGGILTDLIERDLGSATSAPGPGVVVPVPARGFAAVRLLGVRVAE